MVVPDKEKTGIDSINPTNKAEFSELAEAISKKVSQFKNKDEFPLFIEELVRSLCANCKYCKLSLISVTFINCFLVF